ncbi:protein LSM14 homolog B isoform 1-T3 [Synchiropus picturatus]
MNSGMPYIGCKMRLISKAQNRYEGILYTLDKVNSTVVLAKVKCFGTEGRPTNIPTPPKDDVYEYITFRGSDIKDIALCEPPHRGLPLDPAIIQSSRVAAPCVDTSHGSFSPLRMSPYNQLAALLSQQYAAAFGLGMQVRRGPMVEKAVQTQQVDGQQRGVALSPEQHWDRRLHLHRPVHPQRGTMEPTQPRRSARVQMRSGPGMSGSRPSDENRPPASRQGARRRRPRRGQLMAPKVSSATLKFDTDFDFDSSNAKFIKEELNMVERDGTKQNDENADLLETQREESDPNSEFDILGPNCYYDKAKSFFDKISSDNKVRLTWAEERKRNLETFGVPGRFVRSQIFRGGYSGRRGRGAARLTQRTRNGRL